MTYQEYRELLKAEPQQQRQALLGLTRELGDHGVGLMLGAAWALLNDTGSTTPAEEFLCNALWEYQYAGRYLHPDSVAMRLDEFREHYACCMEAARWFHGLVQHEGDEDAEILSAIPDRAKLGE